MQANNSTLQQRLTQWCSAGGPSGCEGAVAALMGQHRPAGCTRQYQDKMGNLIHLFPCGRENAPLVLLDAHMDEIGFLITGYDGAFLKFMTIGGVDPRMLPARELLLLTTPPVTGVITCGGKASDEVSTPDDLRIDTGMEAESLCQTIPVGTAGVYHEGAYPLGEQRFCGKAMDDRSCCLLLLHAMELAPAETRSVDVAVVFSIQEETSGLGASSAAYALNPDYCIAVDVNHGSTPDGPKIGTFPLGSGPAIGVGPNMARWMTELMKSCAQKEGIPYGLEVMSGNTGTNGWELQVAREGIPTGILSLPLRYMHTPVEVFDWADFHATARLLAAVLCALGKEADHAH